MNEETKQKLIQILTKIFLLMKIMYNYLDVGTDLYLIYELYGTYDKSKVLSITISVATLLLCTYFERVFTYRMLKQLYTQRQQVQNQEFSGKISCKNAFKLFFITLLYGDYIYISRFQKQKNFWTLWRKKQVIELFFEHILYAYFGLYTNLMIYHLHGKLDNIAVFSTVLSYLSVILQIFKNYKHRISQNKNFKTRNQIPKSEMSLRTKLFVSYPFVCQFLKIFKVNPQEYPELYQNQIIKKQQQKNQETLASVKSISKSDQKNQRKGSSTNQKSQYQSVFLDNEEGIKQLIPNLSFKQVLLYLYMGLFITSLVFSYSILIIMFTVAENYSNSGLFIFQFIFYGIPQLCTYLYNLSQKYKNQKCLYFKKCLKCIFSFPLLIIIGTTELGTSYSSLEIPFIEGTRDIWAISYYPSWLILLFKLLYGGYILNFLYSFVFQGEHIRYVRFSELQGSYITREDSTFRKLYYIALITYIIVFIYAILYVIDSVLQIVKNKRKLKYQQQNNSNSKNCQNQKSQLKIDICTPKDSQNFSFVQKNSTVFVEKSKKDQMSVADCNISQFALESTIRKIKASQEMFPQDFGSFCSIDSPKMLLKQQEFKDIQQVFQSKTPFEYNFFQTDFTSPTSRRKRVSTFKESDFQNEMSEDITQIDSARSFKKLEVQPIFSQRFLKKNGPVRTSNHKYTISINNKPVIM